MYRKKKVFTAFVASVILCLFGVVTTGKADSIPGTSVSPEYSNLPEKKLIYQLKMSEFQLILNRIVLLFLGTMIEQ